MSIYGRTTDNNQGESLETVFGGCEEAQLEEFLEKIKGRSINDLVEKEPNLLIFPRDLKKTANNDEDRLESNHIFSIDGENQICTGNVMGFLGDKGVSLTISSRFYPKNDDFFLHYLLQRIAGFHVMDLPHVTSPDNPAGDFLPYLFPSYFMKAWTQGVFRIVRRFEHNDDRVRGNIDISRHIKLNIPFRGNIAYSFSERSADNPMTRLIRLTVDVLEKDIRFKPMFHEGDKNFRNAVQELKNLVSVESIQNVAQVVRDNLKPVAHPYYSAYKPLQRLCLAILRHKRMSFEDSKDTIHGVLFSGDWLWEEYLNTILSQHGFIHPRYKKTKGLPYYKGESYKGAFPDFYCKDRKLVIDAKYQSLYNRIYSDKMRSERFQIISYLHILEAKAGILLYPQKTSQNEPLWEGTLNGYGGKIGIFGLGVLHDCTDFPVYWERVKKNEEDLVKWLEDGTNFD